MFVGAYYWDGLLSLRKSIDSREKRKIENREVEKGTSKHLDLFV